MDSAYDLEFIAPSVEELQPLFPAYEITSFIAQGGMGAVYAARQISLDRAVAIKILPRQFGADPQFRASFEAEAKSMARLNHPNLIGVYDFGDADGMLFIIMELVEGKSLHHSAHGKTIEQAEAARLVAGISHGLAHAHQHGILHRDIKPGNILLGPGAQPKIGDFGLARPVGQGHNPDEIVFGTPGYSAPEIVNNPDAVDQRADIFAVGVLLYELLTAQIPSDPWKPPSSISKCRPEFDAVVRRATHPSPEMRYSSAEELAKKLDELADRAQGPILRRPLTGGVPAPTPSAAGTRTGVRPSAPVLGTSKSNTVPIIITILALVLAAVGAMIVSGSKKDQETAEDPKPAAEPAAPKSRAKPKEKPRIVRDRPKDKPRENKPEPTPEPPKPKVVESVTQALARLKSKLHAGDLSNLPKAAAKRGTSQFLLVDQPLTWQAALHFAEDHGAQLAALESAADLTWAGTQFKIKTPAWIGLSDSGTEGKWYWVSGNPVDQALWAPGQPDDTTSRDDGEDFAAILPGGTLDDLAASNTQPFLLEWMEGGNKGSLAGQLKRAGSTLKAKRAPVFPAGTRNIAGSRFLLIPRSASWEEASALSTAVGAHLAVPSSDAEAAWIIDLLQKTLGGGDGCWVGGRQKGVANPQWAFVTGENFEYVTWAPQQPDQGEAPQPALQVWRGIDGKFGYNNAISAASQANYFLMEWSARSHRNMPTKADKNRAAAVEDWLVKYRQMYADREKIDYERWKRRQEKNVATFIDDVESESETARRFSREARDFVDAFVKSVEESGVVPAEIGSDRIERFLGRVHKKALEKQERLWEEYQAEFLEAQERYLAEVTTEGKRRQAQGERKGAAYLAREIKAAAQKDYFLKILSGEFPEVPEEEGANADQDDN